MKIFVDSSVFFAAAYSSKGSAHDLLLAGIRGNVQLVVSSYVLDETERNLRASAPRALPAYQRFRQSVPGELCTTSVAMEQDTGRLVAARDAPIVAAAHQAGASIVASYDRKDLRSIRETIKAAFGVEIMTPEEILRVLGR